MIYRILQARFGRWGRRLALLCVAIWVFTLLCCLLAFGWQLLGRYKSGGAL
jgi:hypothetical protein